MLLTSRQSPRLTLGFELIALRPPPWQRNVFRPVNSLGVGWTPTVRAGAFLAMKTSVCCCYRVLDLGFIHAAFTHIICTLYFVLTIPYT